MLEASFLESDGSKIYLTQGDRAREIKLGAQSSDDEVDIVVSNGGC